MANRTEQPYTRVGSGLPPLYGKTAKALILGSFPSPKSREQGFFYGHPQNRFWKVLAAVCQSPDPAWDDIEAKKALILQNGLAVWDTIGSCSIRGASDASIRDVVPNDLPPLLAQLGVEAVFCNGAASGRLYAKYCQPLTGVKAAVLPSTSPANAAWSLPRLTEVWGQALAPYLTRENISQS